MNAASSERSSVDLLCTWQPAQACQDCGLASQLMCRYEQRDLIRFLLMFFPFGAIVITGVVLAGYGWYLAGWAAYALFFFFFWEARVLCRHCPFWAEESSVLHCHANYGVVKLWSYDPRPMNSSEKVQFAVGALFLGLYPFPFMLMGHQYVLAILSLAVTIAFVAFLRRHECSRCVHFSCPANAVPKSKVDAYLRRNPVMRAAWEESGYKLG
jgi:hypothetical protein